MSVVGGGDERGPCELDAGISAGVHAVADIGEHTALCCGRAFAIAAFSARALQASSTRRQRRTTFRRRGRSARRTEQVRRHAIAMTRSYGRVLALVHEAILHVKNARNCGKCNFSRGYVVLVVRVAMEEFAGHAESQLSAQRHEQVEPQLLKQMVRANAVEAVEVMTPVHEIRELAAVPREACAPAPKVVPGP